MIPSRFKPISSMAICAVCRALMIGFNPKTSRCTMFLSIAVKIYLCNFLMSPFKKVSPIFDLMLSINLFAIIFSSWVKCNLSISIRYYLYFMQKYKKYSHYFSLFQKI